MGLTTKEIGSSSFNDMISSVDRRSEYVENRANANVTLNNFLTPYTLDNKSSILNAPCGYSNGTYASLRPVQTIGPELITNGNFDTDSDWTKGTGWSIANGKASRTAQSGSTACDQSISLIAGKKYKIVYTLTISAGSFNVRFSGTTNVNGLSRTTSGTYVDYLVAATGNNTFRLVGADGSFVGSIDNVSVKEVTDADFDFSRGSSATRVNEKGLIEDVQILSGNLVQNGDFEQIGSELTSPVNFLGDWFTTGATSITENTFQASGSGIGVYFSLTINKIYKVKVSNVSGDISIRYRTSNGGAGTVAGNFDEFIYVNTYNSTAPNIYLRASSETTATVGNVSVKEVGQNWTIANDDANNYVEFNQDEGTVRLKFLNTSPLTTLTSDTQYLSGKKYKLKVDVQEVVSGAIKIDAAGVSQTYNSAGVQEAIIEPIGNSNVIFYRATADVDITLNSVSLIEITDDTDIPRIDYTSGQGALLLEPQSTNLITYSEELTTNWTRSSISTPTDANIDAPDGASTVKRLQTNNADGSIAFTYNTGFNQTSGTTYTVSVYAKSNTNENQIFGLFGNGSGASNGHSGNLTATNDWQRFTYTFTANNTSTIGICKGDDRLAFDILFWGFQIEAGSYATSYIPTEGSTVTRSADVANNSGNADLFNDSEGVLYAEISGFVNGSGGDRTISISDGSTQNALQLLLHNTANRINFRLRSGGSLDVNISDFTFEQNEINKIACKYKSGDYALWINGEEKATSTSSSLPSGLSELAFDDGAFNDFYGNVKSLAVFKEALTDAELAQITSATQQEVFYEMRDRMNIKNYDYYEFGDYTTRLKKLF